jgi:hypothetical protein
MSAPAVRRGVLLKLAAEGVLPVLGGCAGVVMAGAAVGQGVQKAINYFGGPVVQRWSQWLRGQPSATRLAAVVDLGSVTPEEARREATVALEQLAPDASAADRSAAVEYLAAIPCAVQQSLVSDPATGGKTMTVPPALSLDDARTLIRLLPTDVPPYPVPAPLPGTDYRLEALLGTGGFGAVYRASSPSLQYLPLAIKLCLDPALVPALRQERSNLERLMKAAGASWSPRVVRLYGYNLEHTTPFLVYEYVPRGDLVHWLAARQARDRRGLGPGEVLPLIRQVAEALAFAHERGLVHRDLKPANVLLGDRTLKLADFGIGGVVARQSAQVSRIGTVVANQLSLQDQLSLYRGAGTPLYMSREQREGAAPDPRHDLYSLGVMWYQLLVGDVTHEIHPGWASELAERFRAPPEQIALIERCVGWIEKRPKDAGELLRLLRNTKAAESAAAEPADDLPVLTVEEPAPMAVPVPKRGEVPAARAVPAGPEEERYRRLHLISRVKQLLECHRKTARFLKGSGPRLQAIGLGLLGALIAGGLLGGLAEGLRRDAPPVFGIFAALVLWCLAFLWIRDWQRSREAQQERARPGAVPARGKVWVAVLLGLPVGVLGGTLFGVVLEGCIGFVPAIVPRTKGGYSSPGYSTYHGMIPWVVIVNSLLILPLLIRLRMSAWRRSREQARQELSAKVREVLQEFPAESRLWGGQPALSDVVIVEEVLRELEAGRGGARR